MTGRDPTRQHYLLRELNFFGLDHLDPLVLAALADERPLLLIGPHGTAKSDLLNRLASALSLSHRHYNASLISFDDLLGYPVPNADRNGLEYLRTPADLWDAESVFLDEISRCRPEHQNKLFSIIHERRVQGLPLERLRYCWAAMNPPPLLEEEDEETPVYQGSLPLDPSLADRFAWVAVVPSFDELDHEDRQRVIAQGGEIPAAWPPLESLCDRTRSAMAGHDPIEVQWIERYVNALVLPLREAGLAISGRRAVMLARNIRAVHAACQVLGRAEVLQDSAYLTLKWSLPHRAQGVQVKEHKLSAVHREAARVAGDPRQGPWLRLRSERDPVRRVALALRQGALGRIEFSQLVSDAWAGLSLPERYLFSRNLLPAIDGDRLTAATLELLLEPAGKVLAFSEQEEHQLVIPRGQAKEWDRLLAAISRLRREGDPGAVSLGNTLYTLFVIEEQRFDPEVLIEKDREWHSLFQGRPQKEVA